MSSFYCRLFLLGTITQFLVACGGSETAPITLPPTPITGETATLEAVQSLLDTHADPVSYSTLGTIPTTGNASYDGFVYGTLANTSDTITDSLIGEVTIAVAFGASSTSLTGSITNLADQDGDAVTGSLTLSSGSFDRSGSPTSDPTIAIAVSGSLTDDLAQSFAINGQLEGDFLGTNHAAIGGEFFGTLQHNGNGQNIDGGFIVER